MKTNSLLLAVFVSGAAVSFLLPGCTDTKRGNDKAVIAGIQADTTVSLKPEVSTSPVCEIHLDFMYLKPYSEADSLSGLVNGVLQRTFSDVRAGNPDAQGFVDAIKNSYISNYRKDLLKYYEADLHNTENAGEVPSWYNYEYSITSELTMGRDSVWNYAVTSFQYTGGAHPNTWAKWVNIDAVTGKLLGKSDVFVPASESALCELIMKHLITEVNKRMEGEITVNTQEDLQEAGVLLDGDLYVPDNFLLSAEGVTFLYNRYEIAPYSMGDFQLTVPYAEIETYLLKK